MKILHKDVLFEIGMLAEVLIAPHKVETEMQDSEALESLRLIYIEKLVNIALLSAEKGYIEEVENGQAKNT